MVECGDLAVECHGGVARGVRHRDHQMVCAVGESGRVEWRSTLSADLHGCR